MKYRKSVLVYCVLVLIIFVFQTQVLGQNKSKETVQSLEYGYFSGGASDECEIKVIVNEDSTKVEFKKSGNYFAKPEQKIFRTLAIDWKELVNAIDLAAFKKLDHCYGCCQNCHDTPIEWFAVKADGEVKEVTMDPEFLVPSHPATFFIKLREMISKYQQELNWSCK